MYDTKKIIFFEKRLRGTKKLYLCSGEMAERSNAAVLKTVVQQCTGGSNPSFSAEMKRLDSRFCSLRTICQQNFRLKSFVFGLKEEGCQSGRMGRSRKPLTGFPGPRVRIPLPPQKKK